MRRGVRIGVDVGEARVGIAHSDPEGVLASPVESWPASGRNAVDIAAHVAEVAREYGAFEVILGLPLHLSGAHGQAVAKVRAVAQAIAEASPALSIRLVDERRTTVMAHDLLHDVGKEEKKHRKVVDQVAAVLILQQALDIERQTGKVPGLQ